MRLWNRFASSCIIIIAIWKLVPVVLFIYNKQSNDSKVALMLLSERLLVIDCIDVCYLNTCYCYRQENTNSYGNKGFFCHLQDNLGEDLIANSLILLQTCRDCLFSPFQLICFRLHQTIFSVYRIINTAERIGSPVFSQIRINRLCQMLISQRRHRSYI